MTRPIFKCETSFFVEADNEEQARENLQNLIDNKFIWAVTSADGWEITRSSQEEYEQETP